MAQVYVPPKINHINDDGINEVFTTHEKLGHGGFGVVHRVTEKNSNKTYAMKIISKTNKYSKIKFLEKLENEIKIQQKLNHSNIVGSKCAFSDDHNQYIVLEYCPGKSVREYLKKTENGRLSEPEVRKILKDVIQGLIYLHNRKIIHHDLKLENFLIGSDGRVKIADFGISSHLKNFNDKAFSICGTTNYMSPEMLQTDNKGHSFEVDIWALGVSAYIMLTGQPPFGSFDRDIICEKIKKCEYHFPTNVQLSYEARDFIRSILRIDPRKRPTAIDLVDHPFLMKYDKEQVQLYKQIPQTPIKPPIQAKVIPSLNVGIFNNNHCNPILRSSYNNIQIVAPKIIDNNFSPAKNLYKSNENINCQINEFKINVKNNFSIPKHYVTKYLFFNEDLGYLLANGTVGVCFNDRSRMVMDPKEEFIQYYKNYNSNEEVINLEFDQDEVQKLKIQAKIYLLKKFAKNLKKFKILYENVSDYYESCIPLYHVKYFVKKNDAILFKYNYKNIQVNFYDGKKLLIFWNTRKMCIVRSLNQKCNLMGLKDVITMNPNTEENKKYKIAKELLISLSMKI